MRSGARQLPSAAGVGTFGHLPRRPWATAVTTFVSPLAAAAGGVLHPEKAYIVVALMVLSGAFMPLLVGYADASEKAFADPVRIQLTLSGIYIAGAGLLLWMRVFRNGRLSVPPLLILLLAYAAASFVWSVDPYLTLKRVVPLIGTTLVGVYLGARFALQGLVRLVFAACFAMTAGSLIFGLALPQYGFQLGEEFWAGLRGVFANKNTMGSIAALGILISIYHIVGDGREPDRTRFWIGAAGLALAVLCLMLSRSMSSLVASTASIAALGALRLLQRSRDPVVPATGCLVAIVLAGIVLSPGNIAVLFDMFGRDSTLTGRVALWDFAVGLIVSRPWLGYGYAVAWDKLAWYFHVAHVHNGFLQVTLDLGVLGLAFCLLFLAQLTSRCMSLLRRSCSFQATLPAALTLLVLLGNTTEVSLLAGYSLHWCLLVAVAVQTTLDLNGQRSASFVTAGSEAGAMPRRQPRIRAAQANSGPRG